MNIVREEMDRAGGQEVLMPIIQPGNCGNSQADGQFMAMRCFV